MRFRDYFWIAFSAVFAGAVLWLCINATQRYQLKSAAVNRADSKRVATVLLNDTSWTTFDLPADSLSVRLMLNAALSSATPPIENQTDPRSGWRYSVEYELLDRDGQIIAHVPYHLRSTTHELVDADTGERIAPLVFGKTSMVATQTRIVQIPLVENNTPTRSKTASIRIRVGSHDRDVAEIVARVFTRHQRAHYKQPSTWSQISQKSRRNLARFCVFDHKFLTASERSSLLRWQWSKAAAIGSITHRHLYFIGDVDDQAASPPLPPPGVCLQPGWRTTVPVPHDVGELRFDIRRTSESLEEPAYMNFTWFPNDQSPPKIFPHTINENTAALILPVRGGIVEIESSSPVCYRCFWKCHTADNNCKNELGLPLSLGEEIELTDVSNTHSVRVFLADKNNVEFPITHLDGQPTPFRLTARIGFGDAFVPSESLNGKRRQLDQSKVWKVAKKLRWEYLDDAGAVVAHGALSVEPTVSAYDRLWKQQRSHAISDRESFYFSVPNNVTALRFSATQPFLLTGAVRPYNLPYITRIPEDSQPYESQNRLHRKWFSLKPRSHHRLISDNRSFIISTQPRNGLIDQESAVEPRIDPETSQWQRFEPQGNWIGRQLLVPASEENEVKLSSLGAYFFEMRPNQNYSIKDFDFHTDQAYRLAFISPQRNNVSAQPASIKVWHNGQLIHRQRLASTRGQITLGHELMPNPSTLRIECSDEVRLFFSGAEIKGSSRFLKRTACRLQGKPLTFQYDKQSHELETLTLSVYDENHVPVDENSTNLNPVLPDRCKLDVKIDSGNLQLQQTGPVEQLTLLHRIYDIKATSKSDAVIYGTDKTLDIEHKCFLQLGADLPPGMYNITIERLDNASQGYILLHQLSVKPNYSPQR